MRLVFSASVIDLKSAVISIPVDPDGPEARRLLIDELAKTPYREAQPSWFDRLSQAFFDWLGSLFNGVGGVGGGWLPLVATILVAAIVVVALLLWGVPRLNRRRRATTLLFGENDTRSAEEMRAAARAAASAHNWQLATAEQFRALATGLSERTIVDVSPGTTATDFAHSAARILPAEGSAFTDAARAFDEVRYLDHPGNEKDFLSVLDLDERVRQAKPNLPDPEQLLSAGHSCNGGLR